MVDMRDTDYQNGATCLSPIDPADFQGTVAITIDTYNGFHTGRECAHTSSDSSQSMIHVPLVDTAVLALREIAAPAVTTLTVRHSGFYLTHEARLTREYKRGTVVKTEPSNQDKDYKHSLTREAYLGSYPEEDSAGQVEAQSGHIYESDKKKKRNNHFVLSDFKPQSAGLVAPPTQLTRIAVPPPLASSYASRPPLLA
ncbi:hypothetical protein Scep_024066 [Stephania cephalantha]|uniref:Uncharacterized protein n=1 Tax=Stephania cephalantha TaxID=152367 RepID=A0AAP0HXX1_9MAGN